MSLFGKKLEADPVILERLEAFTKPDDTPVEVRVAEATKSLAEINARNAATAQQVVETPAPLPKRTFIGKILSK